MTFWNSGDDTDSRVENKLTTIDSSTMNIEQDRLLQLAVVNYGVNEVSSMEL
jgi:hypothetical protein